MARVLVGAAHTLESPGQIFGDLREADLTRKILKKVVPELEKLNGVEFQAVPLDLPLLDRIEWINNTGYTEAQGDIFVEIHINDGNKRGIESWFRGSPAPDNKSQILAEKINEVICKETGYINQGAKSEHDHELGSLLILNQINCIGTTVELLYIDNEEDIKILKDEAKLDDLAKALVKAIDEYLKNTPTKSSTTTAAPVQTNQQKAPSPLFPKTTPSIFGSNPGNPPGAGASPFGNFGAKPPFGSTSPAPASKSSPIMDREERKQMIIDTYKKVLGKEPNQTDLNFNLNTGVSKDDLIKKLVESPEHEQLVKDAIESKELKDKLQKAENEALEFKSKANDLNTMMINFNKLLHHKNVYISQLQQELVRRGITVNGQYYDPSSPQTISNQPQQNNTNPSTPKRSKKGLDEIIMKILKI